MTGQGPAPPLADDLDRVVRRPEWWPLLRGVAPLVAVSGSLAAIYLVLGLRSDQGQVLCGVPLLVVGLACAVLGFRRRLGEMRTDDAPDARGYPLVFLGWALTVTGLLLPWYLVA